MEMLMRYSPRKRVHRLPRLMKFYYMIKPTIPRRLQIILRRRLSAAVRKRNTSCWPISETAATVPSYWKGWKDGKQFALVLTHDVETGKGYGKHSKLMEIEKELGFVSSFNFVPERYPIDGADLDHLKMRGFEVGVHGLNHDGKLLQSEQIFLQRAKRINQYLRKWEARGFRAPAMHHDLELFKNLDIDYDLSTFDTDPFEPQSDGVNTIFPFPVLEDPITLSYWELPYTLPQDNTLYTILKEESADIWRRKADWIAGNGGMVLLNTHPDYMNFGDHRQGFEEYPVKFYIDFLTYMKKNHAGKYWNPLPREMVGHFHQVYSNRFRRNAPRGASIIEFATASSDSRNITPSLQRSNQ